LVFNLLLNFLNSKTKAATLTTQEIYATSVLPNYMVVKVTYISCLDLSNRLPLLHRPKRTQFFDCEKKQTLLLYLVFALFGQGERRRPVALDEKKSEIVRRWGGGSPSHACWTCD
jgi:hypothetical protein